MTSNPSVLPLRPLSGRAVVWRSKGLLRVTVVVKATFGLVPGGPARLVAPAALAPAELAPFLPHAGVLLHEPAAYAAHAVPVASMAVGVRVAGERPIVDKALHIYGDRSSPSANPSPFAVMPITWERAVGGAGVGDNPVGVGAAPGDRQPNVVHPQDARRPASFAAIPASWPARASRLRGLEPDALTAAIADIPDAFDFGFFQPAPTDQCGPYLRGDEWIQLDGLHPALPRLLTRLPFAVAEARWSLPTARGLTALRPIELVGDLLVLDPARGVGSVVWRGHFTLEREELLDEVQLFAGVALPGYPIPWPEPAIEAAEPAEIKGEHGPTAMASLPVADPATLAEETTTAHGPGALVRNLDFKDGGDDGGLAKSDVQPLSARSALPFGPSLGPSPASRAAAPPSISAETPAGSGETVSNVISPFADEALPFSRGPSPPSARGSEPQQKALPGVLEATAQAAVSPFAKPVAPFALAPPRSSAPSGAGPIPGAPWSAERAKPPPPPPPADDEPGTLVIQADASSPLAAAPPALLSLPVPPRAVGAIEPVLAKLLEKVRAGERASDLALAGADLSGLDLGGADLSGANLRGALLVGTKLTGARLVEAELGAANLTHAVLSGADLERADFTKATLDGAKLDGAQVGHAVFASSRGVGADLSGVTGAGVNLSRGTWDEASFRGAELPNADLTRASLRNADFGGANLLEARLDEAVCVGASFAGAQAARARWHGAELDGATLDGLEALGSQWERASLSRASLRGAKLSGAMLAQATANGASFADADLENANLQRLTAQGADFSNARLDGANLRQARAPEALFDGARLPRAAAAKADFSGARFTGAILDGVNLREAKLKAAVFSRASLAGADLRDADLERADLRGVDLGSAKLAGANRAGTLEGAVEKAR